MEIPCGYYGRLEKISPMRSLSEDLLEERNQLMFEEMKQMEERIKRHITECKREVIREFLEIKSKKDELKIEKENKNGK